MFPSIFYTLYLSILYLKVYKYSFYDAIFGFFYLITYFWGNYNLRKMKKNPINISVLIKYIFN